MRHYRFRRKVFTIVLIAYFLGGILFLATPKKEIFPIFSWFLFALTPNPDAEFNIRIIEYEGKAITPARLYNEAGDQVKSANSIKVPVLADAMGKAIEKHDLQAFERARKVFENTFLIHPSTYELVEITYDPMKRWHTGELEITPIEKLTTSIDSP
ncbi:MAG: hypothetical protein AAF984_07535 [Verrucomicrobiota bacterium]